MKNSEAALNCVDILVVIINDLVASRGLRQASILKQAEHFKSIKEGRLNPEAAVIIKNDSYFEQKACFYHSVLALSKWLDWYKLFQKFVLEIDANLHLQNKELYNELESRNIRRARNDFVAHITPIKMKKIKRNLTHWEVTEIVEIVKKKENMDNYFDWLCIPKGNSVVSVMKETRDVVCNIFSIFPKDLIR